MGITGCSFGNNFQNWTIANMDEDTFRSVLRPR